jgi:hypothetical protein
MKKEIRVGSRVLLGIWLLVGFTIGGFELCAQAQSQNPNVSKKAASKPMTTLAKGTFEVKLNPMTPYENSEGANLGRMSIDKTFHGDLEATSKGEMLTAMGTVKGSAGYVAIERVSGTLNGRRGSFALQHTGTMDRGTPQLSVTVVPDSGTDQLAGLTGKMNIIIADGKHSYEFEYAIAEKP